MGSMLIQEGGRPLIWLFKEYYQIIIVEFWMLAAGLEVLLIMCSLKVMERLQELISIRIQFLIAENTTQK